MPIKNKYKSIFRDIINAITRLVECENDYARKQKILGNLGNLWYDFDKMDEVCEVMYQMTQNRAKECTKFPELIRKMKEIQNLAAEKDIPKHLRKPHIHVLRQEAMSSFDNMFRLNDRYVLHSTIMDTKYFLGFRDYVATKYGGKERFLLNACSERLLAIIARIFSGAVPKRHVNLMITNLEYNIEIPSVIKESDYKDDFRLYATYENNDSNMITGETRKLFDKVAIGENVICRNACMDIVLHRFRYISSALDQGNPIAREIRTVAKYLRDGGILMYEVPISLLLTKECLTIAENFSFLGAIPLGREDLGYTCLILRRNRVPSGESTEECYASVRGIKFDKTDEEIIEEALEKFPQKDFGPVNLLRGDQMDYLIMEEVLKDSPLNDILFRKKKMSVQRPILPFGKGQIGQVMASGELDGVIDEGNGFKHVIRGRVVKGRKTGTENEEEGNLIKVTQRTYTSNTVEINLFAGNGEIKHIVAAG